MKTSPDDIVYCRSYQNDAEAQILTEPLRLNHIPYIIDNKVFSNIYPIGFNSIGEVRVMVFRRDLEKALSLLKEE